MAESKSEWYKDQFFISTSQDLLQVEVINKAFNADYMYWTKGMPEDRMKKMLSKSLCFGVYILPASSSEIAGKWSNVTIIPYLPHTPVLTLTSSRTWFPHPDRPRPSHHRRIELCLPHRRLHHPRTSSEWSRTMADEMHQRDPRFMARSPARDAVYEG